MTPTPLALREFVKQAAQDVGFEKAGVAPAIAPPGLADFQTWLDNGFSGTMEWMPNRRDAYAHPENVLPNVRSVIMLAKNYKSSDPAAPESGEARVARYAWNDVDYHSDIRKRLKKLAARLHEVSPEARTRGVVDTAPLLERDYARLAGLGWVGKNTLLINKYAGSFLFLAALLTTADIEHDEPHAANHCGTCTRCLDVCPTDAFPEPYVLDARKCIAYLNIELRDAPVPEHLRSGMGDWLFGCDDCQDVCPWNRKAAASTESIWQPAADLNPADCASFLKMTDEEFRKRFKGTSLQRTGRAALARNAAIVLGNQQNTDNIPALQHALNDESELVRDAAAWAIARCS